MGRKKLLSTFGLFFLFNLGVEDLMVVFECNCMQYLCCFLIFVVVFCYINVFFFFCACFVLYLIVLLLVGIYQLF